MLDSKLRSFLIKRDNSPVKVMSLKPHLVRHFMRKVSSQFNTHKWAVSDRFPLAGTD